MDENKSENLTITKQQACRFILAHQGLWPPYELAGKSGILSYIRRVGCIQFDPLNIVGHNQELALQARISDFRPAVLQELLYKDRKLLDGWDKNMSIYCTEDWPYFLRNREKAQHSRHNNSQLISVLPQVRKEIEERGPLSSNDLDYNQTVDWPWAPTRLSRAALESMYFRGELIIHHKSHTRKIYDLASRHLPAELLQAPDPNETEEQYHDWYVFRRIGSIGLLWNKSGDAWLGISGIKSRERNEALARLLKQGKVIAVQVEGIKPVLYMRSMDKPWLDNILQQEDSSNRASVLAPLDNLLWDRQLVKELFNFDYRWEVYKPVSERNYGYYVLPVLYGEHFVARFEPGRDKQSGALIIKNWWWEPGVYQSDKMCSEILHCFKRFAGYLDADYIKVDDRNLKSLDWLKITH
ncbi:winged helix-turn-helix domain-containing protein [Sporomusa sp. KB1]|uniref:winged helix-turn-helix domain-containing protein n=1 Tax=Sporomusa sp. KB1 TaxID=943346 RepID=UPI0011A2C565|nr:crosslink repair DNA glycosylase YcaQ family protein [Sporomusa sp. KB1]TWH47576.1 hypothetical protein Salpa_3639 [Sporomusa sp. KB1]